jgi:hypothetical protein
MKRTKGSGEHPSLSVHSLDAVCSAVAFRSANDISFAGRKATFAPFISHAGRLMWLPCFKAGD